MKTAVQKLTGSPVRQRVSAEEWEALLRMLDKTDPSYRH